MMSDEVVENGRAAKRDSLYLSAGIAVPGVRDAINVRVRNLSEGGMMIDAHDCFIENTPIDADLRGIGVVPGRIAWLMAGRAGVSFDTAIDPQKARTPVSKGVRSTAFANDPPLRAGRPGLKPR